MRSKMGLVLILGVAITVGAGMLWAASLPTVGWWKLDELNGVTAHDSSGFGHNGTLRGSAAFSVDVEMSNVLEIYGPSGEVSVPHDASLEPATGTAEVWVKMPRIQNADILRKTTDFLVNRQQAGTFYAYGIRILKDGSVEGIIVNDDLAASTWITSARTKASTFNRNQWMHLALRWDGTTVAIFVNGKLAAASTYNAIPGSGLSYHGASDLRLGAAWGDLEFNGFLSEAQVYPTPLSETEIFNHYSAKAPATSVLSKNGKIR